MNLENKPYLSQCTVNTFPNQRNLYEYSITKCLPEKMTQFELCNSTTHNQSNSQQISESLSITITSVPPFAESFRKKFQFNNSSLWIAVNPQADDLNNSSQETTDVSLHTNLLPDGTMNSPDEGPIPPPVDESQNRNFLEEIIINQEVSNVQQATTREIENFQHIDHFGDNSTNVISETSPNFRLNNTYIINPRKRKGTSVDLNYINISKKDINPIEPLSVELRSLINNLKKQKRERSIKNEDIEFKETASAYDYPMEKQSVNSYSLNVQERESSVASSNDNSISPFSPQDLILFNSICSRYTNSPNFPNNQLIAYCHLSAKDSDRQFLKSLLYLFYPWGYPGLTLSGRKEREKKTEDDKKIIIDYPFKRIALCKSIKSFLANALRERQEILKNNPNHSENNIILTDQEALEKQITKHLSGLFDSAKTAYAKIVIEEAAAKTMQEETIAKKAELAAKKFKKDNDKSIIQGKNIKLKEISGLTTIQ